jgi:hypothetical protein
MANPGLPVELRVFYNGQYDGRLLMGPRPGAGPALRARVVTPRKVAASDASRGTPVLSALVAARLPVSIWPE